MIKMEPVTLTVIAVVVSVGAGFGAGWGLKPDASVEALKVQAQSIDALLDGQTEILTEAQKPVVIDAEIRDKLAETPPACIKDPLGLSCQLQACWQYGQSAAQRPECSKIQDAYIAKQACPEPAQ